LIILENNGDRLCDEPTVLPDEDEDNGKLNSEEMETSASIYHN
jgi:hypothetical protein